jgi:hypothetical protein
VITADPGVGALSPSEVGLPCFEVVPDRDVTIVLQLRRCPVASMRAGVIGINEREIASPDMASPRFKADPYPLYARLRADHYAGAAALKSLPRRVLRLVASTIYCTICRSRCKRWR